MSGLDILASTTNFYRLAKVSAVKYTVFSSPANDDQALLDAEILLRKTNPKVLAVLHSKEFWTFSLNGDEPPTPDPKFNLSQAPTKTFEPLNTYTSNTGSPASLMSILCVAFMKAVKRMLMISLTSRKEIMPFGNAALLPNSNQFLQIEPKLVETGDLLVSLTTKTHNLHPMPSLPYTQSNLNQTHAIYLAPSGIRAYLTGNTIEESTTAKPPNAASIAELLETLHSIQIDIDSCNWMKLVPNLSHLNGMTTAISDFFKPVPNSKFLVWPLELCLVQKAEQIRFEETDWSKEFDDPLSLIDSFVNLKTTATTKTPSNVPTANNTPADPELLHHPHHLDTPSSKPTPDQVPVMPSSLEEAAELNATTEDWDEDLDAELFGDEGDDPSFDFFDEPAKEEPSDVNAITTADNDLMMLDNDDDDDDEDAELHADLASELEMLTQQDDDMPSTSTLPHWQEAGDHEEEANKGEYHGHDEEGEQQQDEEAEMEDPYDIPLHEMMMPSTPPYTDPGAPLPVQSPKTVNRKRSIFSPLNFNPIIKSNVDDKYANGGKFHVPKDVTPSAMSDSGIPGVTLDETFGRDSGDDEDSDEEDEVDSDEYDERSDDDILDSQSTPSNLNISGEVGNDTLIESSMEPELKRLKTGTPVIQLIEPVLSENKGSLSPGVTGTGSPNILPFLLRMIPLHSIPEHIYTDAPKLEKASSTELINTLVHQIVWDDGCLYDIIPQEEYFEQNQSEGLQRAIAQVFPDFHATTLSEYSGVPYKKPMKTDVESPLSSFKAPDYSQGGEFTTTSAQHKETIRDTTEESKALFMIPQPKVKVKRLNQEILVNASALHLWNLMSFKSLKDPKDIRAMIIHPQELAEQFDYFLTSFTQIYEKAHLGHVERLGTSGKLTNGLLPMDFDAADFEEMLDIEVGAVVPTTNTSPKDILVLFPDYDQDLKSTLETVRLFEKIKARITSQSKSQVQVFLKIIPSNFITNSGVYSVLSINRLTRLCLSIYNNIGNFDETFTALSSPPPSNIHFQLTSKPVASKILAEDSFIHLAYERSVDKEWCVAAWSDNKCSIRKVKAWSGAAKAKDSLEKIMDEIWDITTSYASKMSGRTYLVLTRLNGMITDDELLQLKRLSSKSKDLTLIVVSVNHNPRLLLTATGAGFPFNKLFNQDDSFNGALANNKMESVPTVGSSTGMTPSTIFTPQPVNSPDLFTIGKPTAIDSPSEHRGADEASSIVDISDTVHGLIADYASALANTPARLCIKTGFLIKPVKNSNNKLETFEVNLLSCPSTFSSSELMHTMLTQMRNMATIGELYSVTDPIDSLVPWHVAAVEKAIRCLVHIRVEG